MIRTCSAPCLGRVSREEYARRFDEACAFLEGKRPAALGEVEKTEYWVKKLTREAFSSADDGYPGDEDNGTTSAWYILAVLGIYRLCPGKPEWIRFKRSVRSAKILGKEIE